MFIFAGLCSIKVSNIALQLITVYTTIRSMTNSKPVKRGRPLKSDTSSEVLPPVRVTPEQKEVYRAAAKSEGITLSAWLKKAAHEKLTQRQAPKEK